jgi:antitoxin component YwqK of YwqJK toxin-antitoxin module
MKYKSLKRNQEYVESTFINEGNEEIENMLAFLAYNNADNSVIDVLEETSIEDEIAFHDDKVALNKRIYDLLGTVCASEEDAEIMRDGFFRGIGTLELKELYGFDSRITVTTRKRRSLQKVKKHLDLEINYSKFNSKELVEGEVIKRGDNGEIEMKLFVKHSKIEGEAQFFKDGKLISSYFYVNGKREGLYKKYKDGVLEVEGMYSNNEKTGYWKRFHENGKLAEIREWSTGIYVIYDEEGKLEGQGTIKKTTEIEEVNSTYPCGSPKMRGIKHQGKRVGVWTKFYQSGAVEEIANYFDKNAVCFTEKGELEEEFAIL